MPNTPSSMDFATRQPIYDDRKVRGSKTAIDPFPPKGSKSFSHEGGVEKSPIHDVKSLFNMQLDHNAPFALPFPFINKFVGNKYCVENLTKNSILLFKIDTNHYKKLRGNMLNFQK